MKNQLILLLGCALGTAAATAQTQPPKAPPVLLPVLDTDKNGELSAAEIANSSASLLGLDKNADGALSKKEILPPPPKGKKPVTPPPAGPPILVKALDLDKDQTLSADEIEDAPASLAVLDKNADGTISRAELKPGKPPVNPGT